LRRALRTDARDIHGEFIRLLPERPRPIKVQRWTLRRFAVAFLAVLVIALLVANWARLFSNSDNTSTPVYAEPQCDAMEPMWLQAQAVPTAELVPCVTPLPVGWSFRQMTANNGRATTTLDHDRAGSDALVLQFTATCDLAGATEVATDVAGARRFERGPSDGTDTLLTWYEVFQGGCTTVQLSSKSTAPAVLDEVTAQARTVVDFVARADLARQLDAVSNGRLQLDPPS
jgi:hypothetical protein